MDTYKGESLQKKVARLRLHDSAEAVLRRFPDVARLPRVVLASREIGDVGCLLWMHVRAPILAVDREPEALAAAIAKFEAYGWDKAPGGWDVDFSCGDVLQVLQEEKAAHVFLDLCGPLSPDAIELVQRAWSRVTVNGVLSVGLLKGRERAIVGHGNRRARRRMKAKRWSPARVLGSNFNGSDVADVRTYQKQIGRLRTLQAAIGGSCRRDVVPVCTFAMQYQSIVKGSQGVPMMYASFLKSPRGFLEETRSGEALFQMLPCAPYGSSDDQVYRVTQTEAVQVVRRAFEIAAATGESEAICQLGLMLNYSPGTVAAYRANQTRGRLKIQ